MGRRSDEERSFDTLTPLVERKPINWFHKTFRDENRKFLASDIVQME